MSTPTFGDSALTVRLSMSPRSRDRNFRAPSGIVNPVSILTTGDYLCGFIERELGGLTAGLPFGPTWPRNGRDQNLRDRLRRGAIPLGRDEP